MGAVDAFLFALEVIWARCVLAYRLLFALLRRAANRGKRRVAPLDGPRAPEAEAVALLKPPS